MTGLEENIKIIISAIQVFLEAHFMLFMEKVKRGRTKFKLIFH